jgi:uncharacterized protein YdeI (YjbR/CyaY-like superfamily)
METKNGLAIISFADQQAWEAWLAAQTADTKGVWLKIAKKGSGVASVDYTQALEGALCCGWIDGQKAPLDEQFWLQKFTPRGPKSSWSKVNREKAEALIEQGRMRPDGLRQVEQAKADGRWAAAYDSQSRISVPDDFQQALEQNPAALAFFKTLDSANRYAVLYRIQTAKKAETRASWIRRLVEMLAEGRKIHP